MATYQSADALTGTRPFKILVYADAKKGKTHFSLSIFQSLADAGYTPENILVGMIDADDGAIPLFEKGVVSKPHLSRLLYQMTTDFNQILNATSSLVPVLKAHQATHGPHSAWLLVDNLASAWSWTRDKFAQDVYGMSERDLALQRRIEAQSKGNKQAPTFHQRADYGVINPIHNDWIESLKLSGLNLILTAPASEVRDEDGEATGTFRPQGQKMNPYRVDHLLYLHASEGRHLMDILGTRYGHPRSNLPASFASFLGNVQQKLLPPTAASVPPPPAPPNPEDDSPENHPRVENGAKEAPVAPEDDLL